MSPKLHLKPSPLRWDKRLQRRAKRHLQPVVDIHSLFVLCTIDVSLVMSKTDASSAVAVAPPSMLRGKTIEEIVNRWSSELETHVKEFNKFAGEVAVWDRALIENSKNV